MVKLEDLISKIPPSRKIIRETYLDLLNALEKRISKIHLVRNLYFPGPGVKPPLYGLQWDRFIYLDASSSKKILVQTLIHELIHFIFETTDSRREERKTRKAERVLCAAFSDEQKEALWRFIPKEITLENVDNEGLA